ncbi:MAG: DUF3408 domain-containing protein [Dysgonomonas sp.]
MTKKIDNADELKKFNIDDFIGSKKSHPNVTASEQYRQDVLNEPNNEGVDTENTVTPEPTENNVQSQPTKKTVSGKQRKADLLDYQQTFLCVPKISDRKTVFISNELRKSIVSIVRRFGTEKSSVSGFIENLVIHHLEEYREDIESWKKL